MLLGHFLAVRYKLACMVILPYKCEMGNCAAHLHKTRAKEGATNLYLPLPFHSLGLPVYITHILKMCVCVYIYVCKFLLPSSCGFSWHGKLQASFQGRGWYLFSKVAFLAMSIYSFLKKKLDWGTGNIGSIFDCCRLDWVIIRTFASFLPVK